MVDLNNVIKLLAIASLFFLLTLSCQHKKKVIGITIITNPPNELPMYAPPTEYAI